MTAPNWIEAAVRDFGRGAGLADFALNDRGVAAVRFENGRTLRFEFMGEELIVAVTAAMSLVESAAKRILACSHPEARFGARIRSGYLAKAESAVFAVRIPAGEATLPVLNTAFDALWRAASEAGGAA